VRRLVYERLLIAAGWVVLLTIATAAVYRGTRVGLDEDNYWAEKLSWRACADCVLAGDSRIGMGLSPAAMATLLGDRRILNFFFPSAHYSSGYLDAIESLLDPHAARPTIVLGITPESLLRKSEREWFEDERCRILDCGRLELWVGQYLPYRRPLRLDTLLLGRNPLRFHPDGWAENLASTVSLKEVTRHRQMYRHHSVSPAQVEILLQRVERWVRQGVLVYAFRPPTCREMLAVEAASGFDEPDFVRRFEAVGGRWITVDPQGYHTTDGHHLHADSALRLSRAVARRIREDDAGIASR